MDDKKFISNFTEKINGKKSKQMVNDELFDHYALKKSDFVDIGYDEETAKSKAQDAFGDSEIVAQQLGAIHTEEYNPVLDIIFFVLWMGLLFAVHYFLKKYTFNDKGMSSLIISAFVGSLGIFGFFSSVSLAKNKPHIIAFNFIGAVATSVFNYLILKVLNSQMNGNFGNFKKFVFDNELVASISGKVNSANLYITIAVAGAFMLVGVLWSGVYYAKVVCLANTLADNRFRKFGIAIMILFSVFLITLSALFGAKFNYDQQNLLGEYANAYNFVVDVAEKCDSDKEVEDYIENQNVIDFSRTTNADGELLEYNYNHNLVSINIDFSNDVDDPLGTTKKDCFSITFGVNTNCFEDKFDTYTMSKILTSNDEFDEISSFIPYDKMGTQKLEFYQAYVPSKLRFVLYDEKLPDSKYYGFTYTTDNGGYKYENNYNFYVNSPLENEFKSTMDNIVDIVTKNPNASEEKLAKLTNAKLVLPKYTREEYERNMSVLGSYFDKTKEAYDTLIVYKLDNGWQFSTSVTPYTCIAFQNTIDENMVYRVKIGNDILENSTFDDFKLVSVNGGYFDRLGKYYPESGSMIYYASTGKRYTYHSSLEGSDKKYYFVSEDGTEYEGKYCYINSSGYLYVDTQNKLKSAGDGLHYKDSSGKMYTKAFETSWDSSGNLIYQSDDNSTEVYTKNYLNGF